MPTITHQQLQLGDVEFHVARCGEGEPVLLLHGFPELWYSWRHQMQAIADSGRRAIAPDLRGFGGSSAPEAVEAYDIEALTGDLAALLNALEIEQAVVVGHDWGSDLAWKFALLHPDRVSALVGISVPYVPRAPAEPTKLMREHIGEDFYIVWIQEPGVADAALSADVRRTLATREVWNAEWAARHDEPPTPPWMSEEDLQLYVDEFTRTGFTGGLNVRDGCCLAHAPKHPVRDMHFRLRGPVVAQLLEVFAEDWQFAAGESLDGEGGDDTAWSPHLAPAGTMPARGIG